MLKVKSLYKYIKAPELNVPPPVHGPAPRTALGRPE